MRRPTASSVLAVMVPCTALAQQWRVVVLHPSGARSSTVNAVGPGVQVGTSDFAQNGSLAGLWHGAAASWTPLTAAGTVSEGFGVDPWHQVGVDGVNHAAMWSGTISSELDLHPAFTGARNSVIYAIAGGLEAGGIGFSGTTGGHAGYWRGTAESFVDLHPSNAYLSFCSATDGMLEGGTVQWGSNFSTSHAAIWSGTRESLIDLHPVPTGFSQLFGMAPGVQVGEIHSPVFGEHAALWRGSPATFVDMNPSPQSQSFLSSTTGRVHAGGFAQGNLVRAGANFGSPQAWIGLHQFLPPQFDGFSAANAVYQDGPTVYVGGDAEDGSTGYDLAVLWIGTDPCYSNCDESTSPPILNVNDFVCFLGKFASGDPYANCDGSSAPPVLNVNDFVCFLGRFAAGCQ